MFIRLLLVLVTMVGALDACPWCKRYGIKETVQAGQPDPGGLFFGQAPPADKTRHYYIAAEPVLWTWAPLGLNPSKPLPLPPNLIANPASTKVRYVQYTDATFTQRVLDTPRLGILGPVLRGVVGEYLAVTFRNNSPWPLSMHPHGVLYDKDSEGAYTEPDPGKGAAVGPGATFTYVWKLDEASGPQPDEPSSKCWLYHSHAKDDEEINLGLIGMIVVTDPKRARPDGTPADVDREMATYFSIFDEAPEDEALEYANADLATPMVPRTFAATQELKELYARHTINGLVFGNLPGLEMRKGERVRWYLATLGEENGIHTAHWHGARLREDGRRTVDVVSLLPGETKVVDQLADNPGTWLLHCHVSDHMMGGMFANFTVLPGDAPAPAEPFLGKTLKPSMRWTKADVSLDLDPKSTTPVKVALDGVVSIYRGFFPMRNQFAVRIGNHRVPLTFSSKNIATGEGVGIEIRGANNAGVLPQDQMEFALTLEGAQWRSVFSALNSADNPTKLVPIELEIGDKRHTASLALRTSADGKRLQATLIPSAP